MLNPIWSNKLNAQAYILGKQAIEHINDIQIAFAFITSVPNQFLCMSWM